jgi:CHAD domain-containing protein
MPRVTQDLHGKAGDIEIEWQFDALDLRPVERWLAAVPLRIAGVAQGTMETAVTATAEPTRRLTDRYLDTDDWRIGRSGFVLRARTRGRKEEATLKDTRPAGPEGLRRRLEVTEPLGAGGIDALPSDGPVGRRLAAVAGRRPLRQVLEIRTRRRPFSLRVDGEEVAELALDETVITGDAGQRPVHLRRVEVEVASQWVGMLQPWVEDLRDACGLRAATLSKFEAGLLALDMNVPGPPDLGTTEVSRTSSFGEVAFAVIRRHLGVLLAREPGTRLGEDIEELHEMRVSTRRLRAAIEFFADALPARARTFHSELGWLGGVLGQVRDLDVQIERTDEMESWAVSWMNGDRTTPSPLVHLRDVLAEHREAARRQLLDGLDSPRWERLTSGLAAMVAHPPARQPSTARLPAASVLPDLVTARHHAAARAARRARRSGLVADFHRLRIRCKRLRYSLEFTSGVYGARAARFTRRLAKLQDALGQLQDAEVATARLLSLAVAPSEDHGGGGLPAATIFAMGAVAERYRIESAGLLDRMPERLEILHGRYWRDLEAHMEQRKDEEAVIAPLRQVVRRAGPAPAGAVPDGVTAGGTAEFPPAPAPATPATPAAPAALAAARDAWSAPAWSSPEPAGALPVDTAPVSVPHVAGTGAGSPVEPAAADDGEPAGAGGSRPEPS